MSFHRWGRFFLGLLISFLCTGCLAITCQFGDSGIGSCDFSDSKACMSVILKAASGETTFDRDCQDGSEKDLWCIRREGKKYGLTHSGNCLYFTGTWELLRSIFRTCIKTGSGTIPGNPGTEGHFTLCTCNHGKMCNGDCKCDPDYGVCGVYPCGSEGLPPPPPPPPPYRCFCEGMSPQTDVFNATDCSSGQRMCEGKGNNMCYTLAQEKTPIFKNCVNKPKLLECIHGKMKPTSGSGNCVTSTYGQWTNAMSNCAVSLGLARMAENSRSFSGLSSRQGVSENARIKACYCTGELCNREDISLGLGGGTHQNGKSAGNVRHGILSLLVAAVVMVALDLDRI